MKPHPRIRKTVKWGGAAVTAMLVVVWIGNNWWSVAWLASGQRVFGAIDGYLGTEWWIRGGTGRQRGWVLDQARGLAPGGWFLWHIDADGGVIAVPDWIPVGLGLFPTALAWRLDTLARRRERANRRNLCPKCDYDRTGLAPSAVCPECGTPGSGSVRTK